MHATLLIHVPACPLPGLQGSGHVQAVQDRAMQRFTALAQEARRPLLDRCCALP